MEVRSLVTDITETDPGVVELRVVMLVRDALSSLVYDTTMGRMSIDVLKYCKEARSGEDV